MGRIPVVVVSVALSVLAGVRAADGAATRAEKCAVAKLKAANKKVAATLRCYEKAVVGGRRVGSACLLAAGSVLGAVANAFQLVGGDAVAGLVTVLFGFYLAQRQR